jgi:CubicO group peptidase (beta-lactamase class C family)
MSRLLVCVRRLLLFGLVLLLAGAPSAWAQAPASRSAPAEADDLDALVARVGERLVEGQPWTAVVAVLDAEGEAHVRGFGTDAEGRPPDGQTLYEIGSVTKGFVGLLLARAVEEGTLALDQPVAALLPDTVAVPRYTAGGGPDAVITLGDLVTHRAGLPRLPSNFMLMVADMSNPYAYYDAAAFADFLEAHRLADPPGTRYAYSNAGFGLLGYALSRHVGQPLDVLVAEQISGPLGLADVGATLSEAEAARLAQGHTPDGQPAPPWQFRSVMAGAGDLHASADDLVAFLRFAVAPDTTTALGRAMRRAIAPRAASDQPGIAVGYGWHVGLPGPAAQGPSRAAWHNGGTGGYGAFVGFDPDADVGVVVLAGAAVYQDVTRAGFELLTALVRDAAQAHASE